MARKAKFDINQLIGGGAPMPPGGGGDLGPPMDMGAAPMAAPAPALPPPTPPAPRRGGAPKSKPRKSKKYAA